jgi:hypothetical protein
MRDSAQGLPCVPLKAALVLAGCCCSAVAAEVRSAPPGEPGKTSEYFEAQHAQQWRANGTEGIWFEVAGGRWLYATFLAPCAALPSSVSVKFHWSLSADLRVGAAVETAGGAQCAVGRVYEVKAASSTAAIESTAAGTQDADLEDVVVKGAASKDVPQCGLRSVVWALTRPGSAWRLVAPVENTRPATDCVSPSAPGYRWSSGVVP